MKKSRNEKYHTFSKTFIRHLNQFDKNRFRKYLLYDWRTIYIPSMFPYATILVRSIKRTFSMEILRNEKYHTLLKTFIRCHNQFYKDGFRKDLPYKRRTINILPYVSLYHTSEVRSVKRDFFGENIKKQKISYLFKNLYSSL